MITIRRITQDDAELLRQIRLAALRDTPAAFGSTYQREAAFDGQEWESRARLRSRSESDVTFFAFDEQACCGIIGCYQPADRPQRAAIVSMWVAPEARRKGAAIRLLEAVEQWARQLGRSELYLDVVENNAPAIALYEKYGFRFTGETGPYPNDPNLRELFMLKAL